MAMVTFTRSMLTLAVRVPVAVGHRVASGSQRDLHLRPEPVVPELRRGPAPQRPLDLREVRVLAVLSHPIAL